MLHEEPEVLMISKTQKLKYNEYKGGRLAIAVKPHYIN